MKIIFYWVIYPLIRPFYLASVIINTAVLSILIIMASVWDQRGNGVHYIGRFWAWLNIVLSGTRVYLRGREKIAQGQNYLVMANHQSLFDVWALIARMPLQLRWIVKKDIAAVPLFGSALQRMGHIFVSSASPGQAAAGLLEAIERIKSGTTVAIFPEGTRSRNGRLGRFQPGGARLALKSGVPVLPVTINGSRFVLPKNTLALMPGRIEIIVGDPIDPAAFGNHGEKELTKAVKEAIAANLDLEFGDLARD